MKDSYSYLLHNVIDKYIYTQVVLHISGQKKPSVPLTGDGSLIAQT